MFESQLGLHENPFVAGHHPKFVYPSPEHQEALAHLRYGIENREPFVLITGEVGTGKTTAIYDALSGLENRATVALITNSRLTRDELLEEICLRFGVLVAGPISKPQAMVQLERHLIALRGRGELAILLLDEAQNLERDSLEEIRLLSNLELNGEKLMQIFLVGQPELEAKLARPELRQLRQRIVIHYRLNPLTSEETERYVHHRVTVAGGDAARLFPPETCAEIHRITHGIPREINTVAGQALINAFVDDASGVRPEHVCSMVTDAGFRSVLDTRPETRRNERGPDRRASRAAEPEPRSGDRPAQLERPEPPTKESGREERGNPVRDADSGPAPGPQPGSTPGDNPGNPGGAPPGAQVYTAAQPSLPSSDDIPRVAEEPKVNDEPKKPDSGSDDIKMPAWLDEVLEKRKAVDEQMAAERARSASASGGTAKQPGTPASTPPPAAAKPPTAPTPAAATPQAASTPPPGAPPRIAPHPSDPKPIATPGPAKPSAAYISPRLRDKLTSPEYDEPPKSGSGALGWIIGIGGIAVIAGGVVLIMRMGPFGEKTPAPATPAATAAETTGTATVAGGDSVGAAATTPTATTPPTGGATATPSGGASSAAAGTSKPAGTTSSATSRSGTSAGASASKPAATKPAATKPSAGATAATSTSSRTAKPAAPAASSRKYGIEVGKYLNEERANSEQTRLAGATGLTGRVLTATEDGGTVYRVVLGSFDGRAAADKAATDIIGKGSVNQALVVALPR